MRVPGIAVVVSFVVLAPPGISAVTPQKLSWGGLERKEIKGTSNGHTYRVYLRVRNAKADGRRVSFEPASDPAIASDGLLVNGEKTHGFDGIPKEWAPKGRTARQVLETHATEIVEFKVWLDGKRIPISRRKHETMLMPRLDTASAELSKDGKKLTVVVSGSDGAGSWTAVWSIQRSGKVGLSIGGGG